MRALPFLLITLLLTGPLLAQPDAKKADLDKLQGTWHHLSREEKGKEIAGEDKNSLFVVRGNVLIFKTKTKVGQVGRLELIDTTSNPKKLDLYVTDGPNEGMKILAVYEIRDDVFRYTGSTEARPTSLLTSPDDKGYVYSSAYKRSTPVVPKLNQADRDAIVTAANQAIRSHLQLQKKEEIDPGFWGIAIATLKPIRVRNDKVNVAIVLAEKDGVEEGLYVSIPISSYAPRVGDRFTFLEQLSTDGGRPIGQLYHYKLRQNAK